MNLYNNDDFFEAYSQMGRSREGLKATGEWHMLEPLFPELKGKSVLDMGCGYGWHSKYAAQNGAAKVLGFDLSSKMIETAKNKNADPVIEYKVLGLDEFDYPPESYDLAVCNLVLHYIADLNGVYRKVFRTLKSNGVFIFNIEHPVFTAGINEDFVYDNEGKAKYWPIDNYYYPGERKTNFLGHEVVKQHHTLTQILMGLIEEGFVIEAVKEAEPPEEMLSLPGWSDEMRRPMMLLVRAKKP